MSRPLSVLKFGGSSVASVERIHRVARIIEAHHRRGDALVVVVSAMADTTDDLIELAGQVSPQALTRKHKREMDMLLSTGERVSMALLSMALGDLGLEAVSFTGSQSGIITSSFHGEARIKDIRPIRIFESLERGKISIVAGFQGVSESKEITTLGRGGSDTSAVALGAKLQAREVFIYTDVDGVYSADPRKVPAARKISSLGARTAYLAASRGAQVLHHRCLEVALKFGTPLRVLSSFIDDDAIAAGSFFDNGTRIIPVQETLMENPFVSIVTQMSPVALLRTTGLAAADRMVLLARFQEATLAWISLRGTDTDLAVICKDSAAGEFQSFLPRASLRRKLTLLSLVGGGLAAAPEISRSILSALESEGMAPLHVQISDELVEIVFEPNAKLEGLLPRLHALSVGR